MDLRSCSSDLPHQVFKDVDEAFEAFEDIEISREGGIISFEQVGGNSFEIKELDQLVVGRTGPDE